ncbi:MAG: outer membrane lipoprotein-sorting protein [Pseudomonadales bacterium]|nr:outer membrane lipoprotein-sorting protein [Pseudomonadales bacterium]
MDTRSLWASGMLMVLLVFSVSLRAENAGSTKNAESPSLSAREIVDKMDALQRQAADSTLSLSRLSTCAFGIKDKRVACVEEPRVKVMESVSDQSGASMKDSKAISILLEPASERGIGMLTYTYDDPNRDTESWLYLSALGKVKRMASGTGEDQEPVSLFGSEFTTEDMETGKTDEYTYEILQEGPYGGRPVWVIEARPTEIRLRKTNYSKLIFWVDRERFIALKMQTYDKREKLYKRIIFKEIEKINGIWIARDVTVMNLRSQRLSNMQTESLAMGITVDPDFLTQRTLTDFAYREKALGKLRQHF